MQFEFLNQRNVEKYIEYLRDVFKDEPNSMPADHIEETQIRERVCNPFYTYSKSILALDSDKVVGQLEYHFYGCILNGAKMAYVDWIHVLSSRRKQGIASALFKQFEIDCLNNDIDQYYLIRGEDIAAKAFYDKFINSTTTLSPILRHTFK